MSSKASGAAMLADQGAGRCTLSGDLTLHTADDLWRQLRSSGLLRSASSVDLAGVAESDSSGLALLIAWRAACRANGGDLRVLAMPERIAALARLTEAETIVSG